MQIKVLFFGVLQQAAGCASCELTLEAGLDTRAALYRLQQRYPALAAQLPRVACAIGDQLVTRGQPLSAGDTLALIPPVSGG